jgi:DNA-binding PadR family transcriptional regulator
VILLRDNIKGGALTETTFLVLLAFCSPTHGYGAMQFAERATRGRVTLGAGTLYGVINTLLKKEWIAPIGSGGSDAKKEYRITEAGRRIATEELNRLGDIRRLASDILGGAENDDD